jgi:hypothetical protein
MSSNQTDEMQQTVPVYTQPLDFSLIILEER